MSVVHSPDAALGRRSFKQMAAVPLAIMAFTSLLNGCGGGGGNSGPRSVVVDPPVVDPLTPAGPVAMNSAVTFYAIDPSGVGGDAGGDGGAAGAAGDGSPLRRVTVTLTDAKGQQVSGTTDDNGKFLLKYSTSKFSSPLVLRAIDAGGNVLTSTTEEVAASGQVVRASINPLTDKITSDVIAGTVAGTDKSFDGSRIDVVRLASAKADLVSSVKDALGVAGIAETGKFDPVRSVYAYDGTGVDAVIESISHTRDAASGETQLRAKLVPVQTDAGGSVTPTLITAATPLATNAVAVEGSPAMTFTKINAWMNEVNRCLALTSAARDADVDCDDADGSRLVSTAFKHNSKDLAEAYRALHSESDLSAVQGSSLRNPAILFTTSAGAGNSESAVVEFTVLQPRSGPLQGNLTTPIQYTLTAVFRRDDTLTRAKAGNWILYGNQRNYDFSVQPRYVQTLQANPDRQGNTSGNSPSTLSTALTINNSLSKFDVATRTYVSADIRAMRVTGPGLPAAGVVFSTSTSPGTTYLTIDNKLGQVSTDAMSNGNVGPNFTFSSVALDGSALYPGYWNAASVNNADAPLTDFSSMQAFSRYTFEFFLNSNPGNTTPDAVETARILAPVMPPSFSGTLQRNDMAPSVGLVTAPAPGGCTFNLAWTNNANAAPVDHAFIYGANFNVTPPLRSIINVSVNANGVGARPSNVTATAAGTGPSGCGSNAILPLETTPGGAAFRQIGIGATQARYRIYTYHQWN